MSHTPKTLYQKKLEANSILPDSAQQFAVDRLEQLFEFLQESTGVFGLKFSKKQSIQGIYMWGSVGVGKTFLMDLFYECLPNEKKWRVHYNHFMVRIHSELRQETGNADPLKSVAQRLAKEFRILCLDELYITDIGDGMIVYNLLKTLFDEGVVIVITSNFPADKLYKDELQPRLFEPAIALIKANTRYLHLDGQQDYRLIQANPRQTYFLRSEKNCEKLFDELIGDEKGSMEELHVCGRLLPVVGYSSQVVWLTFDSLCNGPRSKLDYIELADRFETILISDIPELGTQAPEGVVMGTEDSAGDIHVSGKRRKVFGPADNAARRFMTLVDELYDRGVNLYLSAEVAMPCLYVGSALTFEFERTLSRLVEMQSEEYFKKNN